MKVRVKKIIDRLDLASRRFVFEREDRKVSYCDIKTLKLINTTWAFLKAGTYVRGLKLLSDGTIKPESPIEIVPEGMENIAEVTKIDPPKKSLNGDTSYVRVYFKLFGHTDEFAKTDVCGNYRNNPKWKDVKVGSQIIGWSIMPELKPQTINADSNIKIL